MSPKIYVIAGPNGIGKTTLTFDLLSKNIPIINSDEIAALMRSAGVVQANVQELGNREAVSLMNKYIDEKETFAIETNLADVDTWKFLKEIQKKGYEIELLYLSTDHLSILNHRIEQRTLAGQHFVRPDLVSERYINSLKLLNHYLSIPEVAILHDNTEFITKVAEFHKGKIISQSDPLPEWVISNLWNHFTLNSLNADKDIKDLNSLDEVRKAYEKLKSETSSQDLPDNDGKEIKKGRGPHI